MKSKDNYIQFSLSSQSSGDRTFGGSDRGVAYITETLIGIIFLSGIIYFALSGLAISEPFLSYEDRDTQAELQNDLDQFVESSRNDGTLKASILNWDDNSDGGEYAAEGAFQDEDGFYLGFPTDEFGNKFAEQVDRYDGSQAAIYIQPAETEGGDTLDETSSDSFQFMSLGSTGHTMVVSETRLVLHDTDRFQSPPRAHRTGTGASMTDEGEMELQDNQNFPIDRTSTEDNGVYATVNVKVIVWF